MRRRSGHVGSRQQVWGSIPILLAVLGCGACTGERVGHEMSPAASPAASPANDVWPVPALAILTPSTRPACADSPHEARVRQFCTGAFLDVMQAAEAVPEVERPRQYALLHLAARAAGERFWEYYENRNISGRWPKEEEGRELRRRAAAATAAYERASASAPSTFERARLTAEWWTLNGHAKFDADSALMRKWSYASLVEKRAEITHQDRMWAEAVRQVARRALDSAKWRATASPDARDSAAAIMAEQFADLATAVELPDDVYRELVAALPVFVAVALPLDMDDLNPPLFRRTMRWYWWVAMMQPRLSRVEREVLDAQVDAYAARIAREHDRLFDHPLLPRVGQHVGDQLRFIYAQVRDNPLDPFFKAPILPFQERKSEVYRQRALKNMEKRMEREKREFEEYAVRKGEEEAVRMFRDDCGRAQRVFLFEMITTFNSHARPRWRWQMPNGRIMTATRRMNRYQMIWHVIGRTRPFPPYPAEKWILQQEASAAQRRPATN